MKRQIKAALVVFIIITTLTGIAYPLVGLAIGQAFFRDSANGSLVKIGRTTVGSSLIAQPFTSPKWFWPRPSATGFAGNASGASNLSLSNPALAARIAKLAAQYRKVNHLGPHFLVPADAVTESASGLDPDISIANALEQAQRVAKARHLPLATIHRLIAKTTQNEPTWLFGRNVVNVVLLNLSLVGKSGGT